MVYILCALLLFVASVVLHILYCQKTIKSGLHAKAFIFIAISFLSIYSLIVLAIAHSATIDPLSLWGLPFRITAGFIFILLIPVYLVFYTLTQLHSPSKTILFNISKRGELSYAEILNCVQEKDFINTRINDLLTSGCIKLVDGRYVLCPSGQKIAMVLNIMQFILGRDMGG